jgi:hypothetical protein
MDTGARRRRNPASPRASIESKDTMKNTSKSDRNDRNRQASAGVQKHLSAAIVLGGASYAPTQLVTILTDPIGKADATTAAAGVYHQTVAAEDASVKTADAVYELLRKEVLNLFRGQPTVLADFGITEPAPKPRTAASKAAAAAKAKATRAAHKAAKAAAVPAPAEPAAPAAAPATTTQS